MSPMKSLSHWNYRVVKRTHRFPDGSTEDEFGIHECHYEPTGWTAEPVAVTAESVERLRDVLRRMLIALDVEVIVEEAREAEKVEFDS